MWSSVSGFFHLVKYFQASSMLWQISELLSFSWLNNILLYRYTTFFFSSVDGHLMVSAFWLLCIMLLGTFACKCLCGHTCSFLLGMHWLFRLAVTFGADSHFTGCPVVSVLLTTGIRVLPCCCCCWVASVMSDSVQPHRRQPTRLRRPWDSPGKNTGVGCHFLLPCMKVKSDSEVTSVVSDSVRHHRRQPTRLRRPWDSPLLYQLPNGVLGVSNLWLAFTNSATVSTLTQPLFHTCKRIRVK